MAIPEHTVVQWQLDFSLHSCIESIYLWSKGRLFSSPPGINGICFWSSFLFSSVAQSCLTLCDPMDCSITDLPVHHQLPEFTQTFVHWVSDAIHPSQSLSSPSPPTCNLSQHRGLFKWVSFLHQMAKVLEFQLQHQPFQWKFRTDSFRMNWLDLCTVQGIFKSLLQHHSSKASILQHSAFFMVRLSHPYMTTGKTIALTRRTFVGKVMSLLFIMLSSLATTFLPRSKHLSISWLQWFWNPPK